MWTRPATCTATSRCWCAAATATARRSATRRWPTCPKLPAEVIAAIEATLKGQTLVPAETVCTIGRCLPHGHVAAVAAMARTLGVPALLGPPCRSRDLALGLIISRVIRPKSKLSTLAWWPDTTLGADL